MKLQLIPRTDHRALFLTEKHRSLQHTALTAKRRSLLKKRKIKPPRTIKTIEDQA